MRKLSVLVKTPVSYLYGGLYLQCTVFLLDKMYTEFCENLSDLWFVLCWKLSPVRNLVHQHRSGAKARWEFLSPRHLTAIYRGVFKVKIQPGAEQHTESALYGCARHNVWSLTGRPDGMDGRDSWDRACLPPSAVCGWTKWIQSGEG